MEEISVSQKKTIIVGFCFWLTTGFGAQNYRNAHQIHLFKVRGAKKALTLFKFDI